jgi:hypothetical protein
VGRRYVEANSEVQYNTQGKATKKSSKSWLPQKTSDSALCVATCQLSIIGVLGLQLSQLLCTSTLALDIKLSTEMQREYVKMREIPQTNSCRANGYAVNSFRTVLTAWITMPST